MAGIFLLGAGFALGPRTLRADDAPDLAPWRTLASEPLDVDLDAGDLAERTSLGYAEAFAPPDPLRDPDGSRAAWARPFATAVEAWIEDRVPAVDDAARRRLAADLLTRIDVDVEVEGAGVRWRGTASAAPGHGVALATTTRRAFVTDVDPELACDNSGGFAPSALGNPVVRPLEDGVRVFVCPHLVAGGRVLLEAVVAAGRFERPVPAVPTEARFLGTLDLARYEGALARMSGTVGPREALETSFSAGARRLAVHVTARVRAPDPGVPDGPLRALDASALAASPMDAVLLPATRGGLTPRPGTVSWEPTPPAWPPERLLAALRRALPDADLEVSARGRVFVAGDEATIGRARAALAAWESPILRGATVRLALRAGDDVVGRGTLAARSGDVAVLRLGADRAAIVDSDPEVG